MARLAESFNRAAARIEELVGPHKLLLANASHELRTPLSRIRIGVELLKEAADPRRKAELERDIAELDALIDEILLSSRLDAEGLDAARGDRPAGARRRGSRALRALHRDRRSRAVCGDRGLLRRMVRNLLDNAERHGARRSKSRSDYKAAKL